MLLVLILILCVSEFTQGEDLKLVTVLFRHGDRTPDIETLYPLDPYKNETYFPVGIGQLTSKGKQRLFEFGQLLRNRYDTFLGDVYYPGLLEAVSTDMDRTKASLQLLLAGAFPPKPHLDWHPLLNWQPIPYSYINLQRDLWMTTHLDKYCPNYGKLYNHYVRSRSSNYFKEHFQLIAYLELHTGVNITDLSKVWGLHSILSCQLDWGFKLPEWAEPVYPSLLEEVLVEVLRLHVATTEMRKLSGGPMLKKIINNMVAKSQKDTSLETKKMILYSAHDINVLYLASVLDQSIDHPIGYGSYYIIELLTVHNVPSVQIYTDDYSTRNITEVIIPGCTFTCPLSTFIKLLEKYIPEDDNICGNNWKF